MKQGGQPLAGVRVLDLGQIITAPLTSMMLGDLGAEVIKLENAEGGDPFRAFRGGRYSPYFMAYNRGKRSITIDLRKPAGKEVGLALVRWADVLVENFRAGVMDRLGLDRKTLVAANPRLVHASITGFGADGPYADRPAFDTVGMALSGMGSLFFDPADPKVVGPTITDNVTGMYAAYGVLGALYERDRTGVGRHVEVNMLESAIAFMPDAFAVVDQYQLDMQPSTRPSSSQSYALSCADGKMVALHLSSQEKFWEGLVRAIERPDLGADPRFKTRMDRVAHFEVLRAELARTFATRPRAAWLARLADADVPFAPVNRLAEVPDDPQVRHLGTFTTLTHPVEGRQQAIQRVVQIDGARGPIERAAPTLGEHTDEVLALLGYDAAAISRLREANVLGLQPQSLLPG